MQLGLGAVILNIVFVVESCKVNVDSILAIYFDNNKVSALVNVC